jgi:ribA/ribD-fused uncharacterized protein
MTSPYREIRRYDPEEAVVFCKTREKWGEFSNMAAGFPVVVAGVEWHTSEALYQACRFPHLSEVQKIILKQSSPMTAKMQSKKYLSQTRKDWDQVRVNVMRWVLRVKLSQKYTFFAPVLKRTGTNPIVEKSHKDQFWGAVPDTQGFLCGQNILGRLLMELREEVCQRSNDEFNVIEPPALDNFLIFGNPVGAVYADDKTEFPSRLF